jgi:hypothetical protein
MKLGKRFNIFKRLTLKTLRERKTYLEDKSKEYKEELKEINRDLEEIKEAIEYKEELKLKTSYCGVEGCNKVACNSLIFPNAFGDYSIRMNVCKEHLKVYKKESE